MPELEQLGLRIGDRVEVPAAQVAHEQNARARLERLIGRFRLDHDVVRLRRADRARAACAGLPARAVPITTLPTRPTRLASDTAVVSSRGMIRPSAPPTTRTPSTAATKAGAIASKAGKKKPVAARAANWA